MRDAPSNPPRRSWFAVWRWRLPLWAWGILAIALPVTYFLSAVPLLTIFVEVEVNTGRRELTLLGDGFYAPVFWLGKRSEFAGLVIAWEQSVMLDLFGRSI